MVNGSGLAASRLQLEVTPITELDLGFIAWKILSSLPGRRYLVIAELGPRDHVFLWLLALNSPIMRHLHRLQMLSFLSPIISRDCGSDPIVRSNLGLFVNPYS